MKRSLQSPHIQRHGGTLRDYNGVLRWSVASVQARYAEYCRAFRVTQPNVPTPLEHTEGDTRWIHPIMEAVIEGIKRGDKACVEIGIEFVEEDEFFAFGKILKSNTARALRSAPLSASQKQRLRRRFAEMLCSENVPHEFQEYAKLLRRIGAGDLWPEIERKVNRENPYVMRYYEYLRKYAAHGD